MERLTKRIPQLAAEVGMETFKRRFELVSSLVHTWACGEEAILVKESDSRLQNSEDTESCGSGAMAEGKQQDEQQDEEPGLEPGTA